MEAASTPAASTAELSQATVWLIRAGSGGRFASDFVSQGIAAIGWPEVGDLGNRDRSDLTAAVDHAYEDTNAGTVAGQLYRFANEVAIGDLVVTPDSQTRELHVGRVTGSYEHREPALIEGHPNTLRVEWIDQFSRDELPRRVLYKLGALMTVSTPSAQDQLRTLLLDPAARRSGTPDARPETEDEAPVEDLYAELRSQTSELIRSAVAELDGYEAQDLVAGILRTMGYFTQVSPEGADGGTDVLAARDPLLVEPPIVRVQVKARPNRQTPPNEVRELAGLLDQNERGVFVSTGGFSREAEREGKTARISLIGMDRLVELLLDNYEQLDQETRALVPLKRLWVP